ncbi:hypothetical protein H6S82_14240 [Planktothrix sp. FACHB-1355]|uniref:Uncharacterized protein n=1 Tax=Aerosakkonema funiforme FACHB-1375 TaxID=2949571 RepID=A0A926VAA0_9CYAN|nr:MULTISPECIES: hypothetical protein [Oscillatoriales]MBD2179835.1 hypothetical protein [Aerosakkonema funiforme FACHB-1375]MBD3560010.1 hypothetical protein [Planktothrix sp. FACHB-1355]
MSNFDEAQPSKAENVSFPGWWDDNIFTPLPQPTAIGKVLAFSQSQQFSNLDRRLRRNGFEGDELAVPNKRYRTFSPTSSVVLSKATATRCQGQLR